MKPKTKTCGFVGGLIFTHTHARLFERRACSRGGPLSRGVRGASSRGGGGGGLYEVGRGGFFTGQFLQTEGRRSSPKPLLLVCIGGDWIWM